MGGVCLVIVGGAIFAVLQRVAPNHSKNEEFDAEETVLVTEEQYRATEADEWEKEDSNVVAPTSATVPSSVPNETNHESRNQSSAATSETNGNTGSGGAPTGSNPNTSAPQESIPPASDNPDSTQQAPTVPQISPSQFEDLDEGEWDLA